MISSTRSPARAHGPGQFRWANEAFVVVGALGQDVEQVLGAQNGQQISLGVAVDGGQEQRAAGCRQIRAGLDGAGIVGDVLQHFQAGDGGECAGLLSGQRLGGSGGVGYA